jgi:hypothetical protein
MPTGTLAAARERPVPTVVTRRCSTGVMRRLRRSMVARGTHRFLGTYA